MRSYGDDGQVSPERLFSGFRRDGRRDKAALTNGTFLRPFVARLRHLWAWIAFTCPGPEASVPLAHDCSTPTPAAVSSCRPASVRFALALVILLTVLRLSAIFATPLELNPEEAQYWLWSRTLDFGYFSKPPMIAWAIWLTTAIGGDAEPGSDSRPPCSTAVAGLALFGVGRRLYDDWTGVAATAVYLLMPGVALSSFILATDAPLLCFLALALLAYVTVQRGGRTLLPAAGLGAALGLAMLSKYAAVYGLIAIGLHLALSREARAAWSLKTAAVAALALAAVMAPNVIWNANHDFATVGHTAANANLGGRLFNPGEMLSFLGGQFGVFRPGPVRRADRRGRRAGLASPVAAAGPDAALFRPAAAGGGDDRRPAVAGQRQLGGQRLCRRRGAGRGPAGALAGAVVGWPAASGCRRSWPSACC
jgi:hypothetical protein